MIKCTNGRRFAACVACMVLLTQSLFALDDGRCLTPPMGWNDYYTRGASPSLQYIFDTADALINTGLADLGYKIVGVDCCWMKGERELNSPMLFKDEMDMIKLSEYLHERGLMPGIYTDIGPTGCGSPLGSYGNYQKDAQKLIDWGYEFIKIDACGGCPEGHVSVCYEKFAEAIAGGLTINICCCGGYNVNYWAYKFGHTWRSGPDMSAIVNKITWQDVTRNLDMNYCPEVQGPGAFNDPDYLLIGENINGKSFGLSRTEERSYFTMYCVMGAPLCLATNLTKISPETLGILNNRELIDIDQDPLCLQGIKIRDDNGLQLWVKRLKGQGRRAVVLFNRSEKSAAIKADFKKLGLQGEVKVSDLWLHRDMGSFEGYYTAMTLPHGVVALLLEGVERPAQDGYLSDKDYEVVRNGTVAETVRKDESTFDRRPLCLGGDDLYTKGLSVKTPSEIRFHLDGKYERFSSDIGIDYPSIRPVGNAVFQVYVDREKVYDSGTMISSTPKKKVNIDVSKGNILRLVVISVKEKADIATSTHQTDIPTIVLTDNQADEFCTWANWADAKLIAKKK